MTRERTKCQTAAVANSNSFGVLFQPMKRPGRRVVAAYRPWVSEEEWRQGVKTQQGQNTAAEGTHEDTAQVPLLYQTANISNAEFHN